MLQQNLIQVRKKRLYFYFLESAAELERNVFPKALELLIKEEKLDI